MTKPEITTLTAMMGTYRKTAPLKDHTVSSTQLTLDFADVDVAQKAFKDVVRKLKFDVAELAIVTFLQAFEAGKPYLMLPFVMNGNFHHKSILCQTDSTLQPGDLAGKSVAMRSYAQTTPTWVRGILSDDYGVCPKDVHWMSQEGAHVAEYEDPDWVERIAADLSLEELLRAGKVDAIIAGGALSGEPGIRPLIPSPAQAALQWHERTRAIPINHVVTLRKEIVSERPELVTEIYRMLRESRVAAGEQAWGTGPDLQPCGFEHLAPSLDMAIRFAFEQGLIRKRYAAEELYGDVTDILG
jgi:4,5-dihydroxyphthalate decarboxylase